MTTLSDDLEDLLEAERDIDVPARAERQRMFARLEPLLVVPIAVAVGSASATTAAEATGSAALSGMIKGKIVAFAVSAAALGAVAGATGHAYLASPAPRAAPVPSVRSVSRASAPEPVRSAPEEPAAAEAPTPTPPSGARQERSRPVGSLRAERLLLETASAALMRGDTESAILVLRQHARQFPNGALAEEREVLLKRALASSQAPR